MTAFDDRERARIREALIETGRERFARYGLRKTTIADLTEPVGIATGTFYRFFDSKEELFWTVLEGEREDVLERYEAAVEAADGPQEEIVALLMAVCEEIETNPLTRAALADGEVDRLLREMSDEELAESHRRSVEYLLPYVESWQEAGVAPETDPEVVAGTLRAVTFVILHRNELGPEYPAIRETLIERLAAGLVP
ncbi:TetR/AcrR family transcriptional regulator [Halalkalicoccus salilacus]|uniref:TetR/AcrR family transcriptional regulator n=1 Tax=Halalkalicoccus TaxID=332246 RepID=UPI002F969894